MIIVLPLGGCNGVTLDLNLPGNHTVTTQVVHAPTLVSPWNVSIQYDDVYYASFSAPSNETTVVPQYILNRIVVWGCNSSSYLTGDYIDVEIYIDGSLYTTVDIQFDLEPIYPVGFTFFANHFVPQVVYSLYNFTYGPINVTLTVVSDPIVEWTMTTNVYSLDSTLLYSFNFTNQVKYFPNGCLDISPYSQSVSFTLNGQGYIVTYFDITYPKVILALEPIVVFGCYETTENINGQTVTVIKSGEAIYGELQVSAYFSFS